MKKLNQLLTNYFGLTEKNYPDLKNRTDALTIFYFMLSYAVAWASYLPVYFFFMKNIYAGLAVLLIGLPTSVIGLFILKFTKNVNRATTIANVGGGLNLIAISAFTGGAWSPIFGWLFVAITAPFLLQSGRSAFSLATLISVLSALVTIFIHPIDSSGWGFDFQLYGDFHRYFNAFTYSASLLTLGVVAYIFRDKIANALIESEKAKEEALVKKAEAELANKKTSAVVNSGVGAIATFDKNFNILLRSEEFNYDFGQINSLMDVLPQMEVENKATLKDGLNMIFGLDELSFVANETVFPVNGKIKGRRHSFKWTPFYDQNDEIVEMVFTATDNEESLKNLEMATKNAEDAIMMKKLVKLGLKKTSDFLGKAKQFLSDAKHYVECEETRQAYVSLHTFKGAARTLEFSKLAELIHETESSLNNKEKALTLIKECANQLGEITVVAGELGFSGDVLIINKKDAQEALSSNKEKEYIMDSLYSTLETEIMSFAVNIPKIAKDLGKEEPKLMVITPKIYLKNEAKTAISNAFVHILRNSIDHGIETAEERKEKGKQPAGSIVVNGAFTKACFQIRISDDGKGLALRRIFENGLEKGLIQKADNKPNPNEVAELIFMSGFSTAKSLTITSGRGVGMDAVRSEIEGIGGKVYAEVYSDGQFAPWELVIEIPLNMLVSEDSVETGK